MIRITVTRPPSSPAPPLLYRRLHLIGLMPRHRQSIKPSLSLFLSVSLRSCEFDDLLVLPSSRLPVPVISDGKYDVGRQWEDAHEAGIRPLILARVILIKNFGFFDFLYVIMCCVSVICRTGSFADDPCQGSVS